MFRPLQKMGSREASGLHPIARIKSKSRPERPADRTAALSPEKDAPHKKAGNFCALGLIHGMFFFIERIHLPIRTWRTAILGAGRRSGGRSGASGKKFRAGFVAS